MSQYLKELITDELKSRFDGVTDALLVDVIGMDVNSNVELRKALREKNIKLMVVKNSLARRATEGSALAPAFEGAGGTIAVVWGGEDVVSLAKEVVRLAKDKKYEPFAPKGGVTEGAPLSADDVIAMSKWPSRSEQLSLLVGQILSPGANLAAQILGPGGKLTGQIKSKSQE